MAAFVRLGSINDLRAAEILIVYMGSSDVVIIIR